MTDLDLPAVLAKGDTKRVAHTSSDYWHFVFDGFTPTDDTYEPEDGEFPGESPVESDPELPTPVEVVQRTSRAGRRTSSDGDGQTDTQGTAAGEQGGDLTATPQP
jgi:hypothetical protein